MFAFFELLASLFISWKSSVIRNMWRVLFLFPCVTLFTSRFLKGSMSFLFFLSTFSNMQCCFWLSEKNKSRRRAKWRLALTINLGSFRSTWVWNPRCGIRRGAVSTGWLTETFCSELVRALWSKVGFLVFLSLIGPRLIPRTVHFTAPRLVGSFKSWSDVIQLQYSAFICICIISPRKVESQATCEPSQTLLQLVPDHFKLLAEVPLEGFRDSIEQTLLWNYVWWN